MKDPINNQYVDPYVGTMMMAGAEIHAFQCFGSYQGDWWAKVTYEGLTFWLHGYYGSCSGCDAFQAAFGWNEPRCEKHKYKHAEDVVQCVDCANAMLKRRQDYIEFGKRELDGERHTQESALEKANENIKWDSDATKMVQFITNNPL